MQVTIDDIVTSKTARSLDERALRSIFLEARTASSYLDRAVPHELLDRALEIALLGPTSANTLPLRIVFVESAAAKERLKPALSEGNLAKTMAAPVTAIVAADLQFFEYLSRTLPGRGDAYKARLSALPLPAQRAFASDNAVMQMAYFMIAARAVGLDVGPMGGFDRAIVDAAFFPDGRLVSLYLINIGYGDDSSLLPRNPRLDVHDIARYA